MLGTDRDAIASRASATLILLFFGETLGPRLITGKMKHSVDGPWCAGSVFGLEVSVG